MSIITTPVLQSLWTDAQQVPLEWATTRFWEHIFNRIVFNRDPWVVSSQQPPLHDPGVAHRVDLVVERIDPATGGRGTVLFVELKRTSATQTELTECKLQAYTAGCEYFTGTGMARVWAMTCIGNQARLWIFYVNQGFLVPYFPTSHSKAVRAEYVESPDVESPDREAPSFWGVLTILSCTPSRPRKSLPKCLPLRATSPQT
jgi:hypothetical protein